MPVRLNIHLPVEGGQAALQWPVQINKAGRGPDSGMEDAPMKQEPEVTADPRGTAVNMSIVQLSLEP